MNEPHINSFEEFLFFYLAVTVLLGALWVILEADVLLGPTGTAVQRRRRQRAILNVLTVLGVLHPACGLIAFDASRREDPIGGLPVQEVTGDVHIRRRARVTTLVGVAVFALLCAPHLPVVGDVPAIDAFAGAMPWESA